MTAPRLFAVVLRINRDRGEAEDLLQDVYLKVWQQCDSFDSRQGTVAAWLAAVAHNTAVSSLRRRNCRPPPAGSIWCSDDDADATASLPCNSAGPLDRAMRREAETAVRSSLRRLNNEQRESLSLAFFDDLSHQDIATRLGRPLGSVKSTLRRAMLSLRPVLKEHALPAN